MKSKLREGGDLLCTAGAWGVAGNRGACAWVPGLSLSQPRLSCTSTLVIASGQELGDGSGAPGWVPVRLPPVSL